MEIGYEIVGWVGTALIVGAYFLNSRKLLPSENALYQVMNLVGALFVGAKMLRSQEWSTLTLQLVWIVIALSSLVRPPQKKG